MSLTFDAKTWLSSEQGPDYLRHTSTLLGIEAAGKLATHSVDEWSRSVTDRIRVSAWPLALWLASNWWRLRWEPAPARPDTGWRMAHELTSCGYGFIWPRLRFESDGEEITLHAEPSEPSPTQPIEYLSSFHVTVPVTDFERSVDSFVDLVIARLAAVGVSSDELTALWTEARAERSDAEASEFRRIEAQLGFDPDDAPVELVERLLKLRESIGSTSVRELAPAASGPDAATTIASILRLEQQPGVDGAFELPNAAQLAASVSGSAPPWDRARELARALRRQMGLGDKAVPSLKLAELLGVQSSALTTRPADTNLPVAITVRKNDRARFLFRRSAGAPRRFEAARFISAALALRNAPDRWLTSTDAGTAHQKFQRAFAAELLAPIEVIRQRLGNDLSQAAIDDLAAHFDVSPLAITAQLANHGDLPHEAAVR